MPSVRAPRVALVAAFAALALPATAQNLIVNGDFEAGFTGFTTQYTASASGCIGCVGVAATTLGWYNVPGFVFPYGDHTSGSGRMLQYDPPVSGSPKIWAQTVTVSAGTTYTFSGWVREANSEPGNNGRVGVYAGATLLGTKDAPDGAWGQWSFDWTAPSTGPVELALRDLYGSTFNGTYSTIDDLVFAPVPEPATLALWLAGLCGLAAMGSRPARRRGG
jgi:hypothetical protein